MEFKEIFKLKEMLEKANIPFEFYDRGEDWFFNRMRKHYQLCYPKYNSGEYICSVIQGDNTYGGNQDLLEIMGLLTEEEAKADEVKGYLTAENVFDRIQKHYKEVQNG